MPMSPGSRFGPYEIVAPLGAGGMGEVYRARDTRLGRDVAVKILPEEMAKDASRRQRFELEARAVAALNHPNIVAVYDVGEGYIVSELVDGESLRGQKPGVRKAIDIAVQIAGGLAAAHTAGITHRDLKPENILLTRDGRVKILDFGLAKMAPAHSAAAATDTVTAQTDPGVVVGTVGYMSPEQVRGQAADHRSDIFSFGLILYELVAGRRAFAGETTVDTMQAILRQEPPELPESVPEGVRQIVAHCLEKEWGNRFQSAKDLAFALTQQERPSTASGMHAVKAGRQRRFFWPLAVLAGILAAIPATHALWRAPEAPLWNGVRLGGPEMALDPRVSPDGHLLAFQAVDRELTQVALMKPESGNWSVLTHRRDRGLVIQVSWSPDGTRLYYDRTTDVPHGIYSVPVLGGEEHLVLPDANSPEALPDGSMLAARINRDREMQWFRFWPDSGRMLDLPLLVMFSDISQVARAAPAAAGPRSSRRTEFARRARESTLWTWRPTR
jgi:predicted Ser/Thr protein kinase